MGALGREWRRELERAVKQARRVAEAGARKALEQLAAQHHEPWPTLSSGERALRTRLRAHGRQLGDERDERRGTQGIERLTRECAYAHWHRMLFARFLAEAGLLIEPASGVAISLGECQELARERRTDWWMLASEFAERMLPQIFRKDDPVLELTLPPEARVELEELLGALPREVFLADDSLGWVYQFWQAELKDEINRSERKIGADELPAVTQLFTEDYMVLFLLHNTLGAWWAGKVLAARPELATEAKSEDELRAACAVGGVEWTYLRFVREGDGPWRPAAGIFEGWPKAAKDITVLDPCMGSGHFLVFALPMLTAVRAAEEGLSVKDAITAVLRENLFGLEIDLRCTQIAAFNLALTAWRLTGYQALPALHLACSGLSISTRERDWVALAGKDSKLRAGMERLYRLFEQAPILGSLINPRALGDELLVAEFHELQPLLEQVLAREATDEPTHELAVTARGLVEAAEILASQFTLVATNVPYLGRGKQDDVLKDYCERMHQNAKADLATCFVERCLNFCTHGASRALVTPQKWLFQGSYKKLRQGLIRGSQWDFVARLGPKGFQTSQWDFDIILFGLTHQTPPLNHTFSGMDVAGAATTTEKAISLTRNFVNAVNQCAQSTNPDAIITLTTGSEIQLLSTVANCFQGLSSGDNPRHLVQFWELPSASALWKPLQMPCHTTTPFSGREMLLRAEVIERQPEGAAIRGREAWGRQGVGVARMASLAVNIYSGGYFSNTLPVIVPKRDADLSAIWAFAESDDFSKSVREVNQGLNVDNGYIAKAPFDLNHWQRVASQRYPEGLPKPHSDDPTQWLFAGHPGSAEAPLQVLMARLLGYRWPRQTGSSFPDCPALGPDGLESYAAPDGIVCLMALRGEQPAAARARALLGEAFRTEWSVERERQLIAATGSRAETLEEWLRDDFFAQHGAVFQQRPFIWHVWDGQRAGFNALVNYHRLAGPAGEGRRTLERLTYAYLGDWIDQQRAEQRNEVEGADARLAAAEHLKDELEKILTGDSPYDVFVRWKPLHEQPIGWEPDINDGIRLNIRPFMVARPLGVRVGSACILRVTPKIKWEQDRGKEPHRAREDFPWFWGWDGKAVDFEGGKTFDGVRWNGLHYTAGHKQAARARRSSHKASVTQ